MLDVTSAATDELKAVRQQRRLDKLHAVRVGPDDDGHLHLTVDAMRPDDEVIDDPTGPLVLVSREVAGRISNATLDYAREGDERGFVGFVLRNRMAADSQSD